MKLVADGPAAEEIGVPPPIQVASGYRALRRLDFPVRLGPQRKNVSVGDVGKDSLHVNMWFMTIEAVSSRISRADQKVIRPFDGPRIVWMDQPKSQLPKLLDCVPVF